MKKDVKTTWAKGSRKGMHTIRLDAEAYKIAKREAEKHLVPIVGWVSTLILDFDIRRALDEEINRIEGIKE